jgi:polyhydroxyalkanoate synthesis regulator protein
MELTKVIKRYRNRKLYSPDESRYVTLSEVFSLINEGWDVKVVDVDTSEDITLKTLKAGLVQLDLNMDQVKSLISNNRRSHGKEI